MPTTCLSVKMIIKIKCIIIVIIFFYSHNVTIGEKTKFKTVILISKNNSSLKAAISDAVYSSCKNDVIKHK